MQVYRNMSVDSSDILPSWPVITFLIETRLDLLFTLDLSGLFQLTNPKFLHCP
jgi:hypothetical protein